MLLIIGYGNTLRGDDGVGQLIAHRLEAILGSNGILIIACHQLTPELVETISRADEVVFVDVTEDGQAGDIRSFALQPETAAGAFTHNISPSALLAASANLYGVCPRGQVISISGTHFDYGETLSLPVEKAIPQAVSLIRQMIEDHRINRKTQDIRIQEGTT